MTEQKAERRAVDEVGGHPRSVALGERTQYKLKTNPSTSLGLGLGERIRIQSIT